MSTTTTTDTATDVTATPLTIDAALALSAILAATAGRRVARLIDGRTFDGTALNIVTAAGDVPRAGDDVRACLLRVAGDIGYYDWPIAELINEYPDGGFVTDYHRP